MKSPCIADLQSRIDAMAYPPTMDYTLSPFAPRGVLADRLAIMEKTAPEFFKGGCYFLDVGCSKGFFTFYLADRFDVGAFGIDASEDAIRLCWQLSRHGGFLLPVFFADINFGQVLLRNKRFSHVLFGNVHHYIFVEHGGWDWIKRLAAITMPSALVLIEGPLGMECRDMEDCIPADLQPEFTAAKFCNAMNNAGFQFIRKSPSPTYTPDRYVMLWEKSP